MEQKELYDILDQFARTLVGVLSKRVEVLEKEDALNPNLYKALAKESIYENFRALKSLLNVKYSVGKVNFIPKGDSK